MRPELSAKPWVYYRNFRRYTKCFIGGAISVEINGARDCLDGASVSLLKDGVCIKRTTSDNDGDFKFDRVNENSGRYTIELSTKGSAEKTIAADLGVSGSLGEIRAGTITG